MQMRHRIVPTITCFCLLLATANKQAYAQESVRFSHRQAAIDVSIGGKPFTSFLYPDSLPKPVLFPVYAPGGAVVTRGFPLATRPEDPQDHPHHIGIWMNFENVNGLDFWNNSYAIPAEKKAGYGAIKTDNVYRTTDGKKGSLEYHANWVNQQGEVLLEENTQWVFSGSASLRRIERITTLKARQRVLFKDAKDGFLGFRVARELELPRGNYLNSEGLQGDSAWGKRARWCRLSAPQNSTVTSIVILDHPSNTGYPAYWHARGYGLFAVNPLGAAIFSEGRERVDLHLEPGQEVRFQYTILIATGKEPLPVEAIEKIAAKLK